MRRRRFLGMGAGGIAGAAGLAATTTACAADSGSDQVVLRLLATEYGGEASDAGSTERYWNDVVNEFREEYPDILINVSVVRYQDANTEVARLVRRGTPPDIAQVSAFADFAEAEQLYPASVLLTLPVLAEFIPSIAAAGERRRIQYGMPFASSITRLYYNKRLFSEAGLDDERAPADWGELLDAALALRSAGVTTPFALPFAHAQAHVEAATWMISGGGGLTDDIGSYTIDAQANIDTFAWLRDELVGQDLCGPGEPNRTTRDDAFAAFAAGDAGMIVADSLLMRQAEFGDIDFATAQMPGTTGPNPTALGYAAWVVGFNQNGHKEEIATFLDFVYTNTNVPGFSERYDLLPVTTPAVQAMSESSAPEDERMAPFLDDLPSATFYPVGKVSWAEVASAIGRRIGETMLPDADIGAILGELQTLAEDADRREDAV
ncbi:extracellular solute-binding protein [Streptomyces sp. 6N223]|uniref:extracellular solute-binding protein n=1 Tax=Streptomyces sp. 6N223 TaxID=3457412 RepID=UPI003FD302F9